MGWLPAQDMLNLRDAIMPFKCIKGLASLYLSDKFESRSEIHNVNTRSKNDLNIPPYTAVSGQRTFYNYRGVIQWNNLPKILKILTPLEILK